MARTGHIDTAPRADRWREIQLSLPGAPVNSPRTAATAYNVQHGPTVHRDATTAYIDGTDASNGDTSHNVSRGKTRQHRIGSVPVRLQRRGREGANFAVDMKRTLNRDQRRMLEYNERKRRGEKKNQTSIYR